MENLEIQPRTRFSNPFGAARPREEVLAEKLEVMTVWEAPPERSFGRRGFPVAGEENGSAQQSESRAERAWKKPVAVEAANESEDGYDNLSHPSELLFDPVFVSCALPNHNHG